MTDKLKGQETVTKNMQFGSSRPVTAERCGPFSSPLFLRVELVVIECVGGGAVGLEPCAIIIENVPRLIGVVKVQMWLGLDHNGTVTVYLIHLHHPTMLFLCFLQHFSVLLDQPLPVVPHD